MRGFTRSPYAMRILSAPIASLRCGAALLALCATLGLVPVWRCAPRRWNMRRSVARLGWAVLLSGFGIRVRRHGELADPAGALIVANHISWVDIAVLAGVADAGFIAKAEIASWPVIGRLASLYGCLFVERNSRAGLQSLAQEMGAHPERSGLILFPEGTTGGGDGVLPFRSSLFACIGERWPAVQPVTIAYRTRAGGVLSPQARRRIAWLDDDALLPHAFALAAVGGAVVDVWIEPCFTAASRKDAAETSYRLIAARLEAIAARDQAATLKRAA